MPDLYLLRHAKSDWSKPGQRDYDRKLAARGQKDATRMGRYMKSAGYQPAKTLCSSATRTRETFDLVLAEWDEKCDIEFAQQLYGGGAHAYFNLIRALPDNIQSAMVVGHNPTTHQLALAFSGDGPADDMANLRVKYPTCGLAVIRFAEVGWSEIDQGGGELIEFTTPKSIT